MPRLSVDNIVNVSVNLLPGTSENEAINNIGLILGTTNVISAANRMKLYNGLSEMLDDGFTSSAPEYLAADLYFRQSPAPKAVYIGRINSTASETPTAAYQACRDLNSGFYGVYSCGASVAEQVSLAAAVEADGKSCLFFESANSDCLVQSPETPDIFTTLRAAGRKKAMGIYHTEDYAGAALLGLAMGLDTGKDGSSFDMYLKKLNGILPTASLTQTQLNILEAKGGNAFVTRGQDIEMLEMGNCVDGTPYDETMYLDKTCVLIQNYVLSAMTGNTTPKIAQTDDGMAVILSAVNSAMEYMKRIGFVAPGTWTAPDFATIKTGDMLPAGYMVFADPISDMPASSREARQLPNVYVAMKLSGSGRSVSIGVNVNR